MNKFWELFEESVIVQGVITLFLVGATCYRVIIGEPIPDELNTALLVVLGFWFGSKSQQAVSKTVKRLGNGQQSGQPADSPGATGPSAG